MKATYIQSASVLLESDSGTKILCDPWFTDGIYYGSWYHCPPLEIDYKELDDIDAIYISHVHPDHMDLNALNNLPDVPILILEYQAPFLKRILESGVDNEIIEIPHGSEYTDIDGFTVQLFASDNCDPEICNAHFECAISPQGYKKTLTIDSLSLISDASHSVLNTNDCPWVLSRHVIKTIKKPVDLLLVGYSGAGPYPQCFDLSPEAMAKKAAQKKAKMISWAKKYIAAVQPRFFFPFAGEYVLGGRRAYLNKFRGVPLREELPELFDYDERLRLPNRFDTMNLEDGRLPEYIPDSGREEYIQNVLINKVYPYEEEERERVYILSELREAYKKMLNQMKRWGFRTETNLYIHVDGEDIFYRVPLNYTDNSQITGTNELKQPYVKISLDQNLLLEILERRAHWNNAEIGSHLFYERKPDKYERGIYWHLSFLHK